MGVRPGVARTRALLGWYQRNRRDLPWRETSDPYRILVSEVMLQQTRAQAVIPYYEKFIRRFPTADALASAAESAVLALWSGLGYYSRARNLHKAARQIAAAGAFPREYTAIRGLPGVGDYTAAAVASIAFGLPHAVIDGNVLRVIARVENDASDIGSARVRQRFGAIAQAMLARNDPGSFNQALMELGATVCLPRAPLCGECPWAGSCSARAAGTAAQLPVKLRRTEPIAIETAVLVVRSRNRVLLRSRRADASRLAGFWELPSPEDLPGAQCAEVLGVFRHCITHHRYMISVVAASARAPRGFRWFRCAELSDIPLSTTARKALRVAKFL